MASLIERKNGRWAIQFYDRAKARRTISLGEIERDEAEIVRQYVKRMNAALVAGDKRIPDSCERWAETIGPDLRAKLIHAGLLEPKPGEAPAAEPEAKAVTLAAFIDAYIAERDDVKPGTRAIYEQFKRNLIEHFGEIVPLNSITAGGAEDFERYLKREGLSRETIKRRLKGAKQIFAKAVADEIIPRNPFARFGSQSRSNEARVHFVSLADIRAIIDASPNAEWRLLWAMARYAGCRIPSEAWALRWEHVDFQRKRLTIRSPKTERYEGGEERVAPLWGELEPFLRDMLELAGGKVSPNSPVFPVQWATRSNLRTQAHRIIRKAGLTPWPKPFQNCRSSRQTELAAEFPMHVVCAWLGNSPDVAKEHYLQVTAADYEKALHREAARCEIVSTSGESAGIQGNDAKPERGVKRGSDVTIADDETSALCLAGPQGFEP